MPRIRFMQSIAMRIQQLWDHAGFQKYLRNTGWMLASRVLCIGISFLTTAFVARNLGPSNYGQLSYALSFISLFSFLATLGIDQVLYRDILKNPNAKKEFLGSALTIKLIAGTGAALLAIFAALAFAEDDVSKILIVILSGTFIFNAFQIINYEFQAQVQSKYPSLIALAVTLILNVLKIIAILNGAGVIYLSAILLLESFLYAGLYWFFYKRKLNGKITEWRFSKPIAATLLKDSWPLIFATAFALIYSRIDQILIKHLLDEHSVGIYGAAVTVAEVWYFLPTIILGSLFPAIMNTRSYSHDLYHTRLGRLGGFLLLLAIGAGVITTLVAEPLMTILYGQAFLGGVVVLKIYAWSNIGSFLNILATNYLVAENKKNILFLMYFVPMVTNIILNLLFIPVYGIVGSAWATLISYSLGPIILLFFSETRRALLKMTHIRT